MIEIYKTAHYTVYFLGNKNATEVDFESLSEVPTHKIDEQYLVVNTFLFGIVEAKCSNLPNAIFYANSYSKELSKILNGERTDLEGRFSPSLQSSLEFDEEVIEG